MGESALCPSWASTSCSQALGVQASGPLQSHQDVHCWLPGASFWDFESGLGHTPLPWASSLQVASTTSLPRPSGWASSYPSVCNLLALSLWRPSPARLPRSTCSGNGDFLLSSCSAQALGREGFSNRGSWALKCRLRSCGAQPLLLHSMWRFPSPGMEPMSPALAGGLFITESPGKPLKGLYSHESWTASLAWLGSRSLVRSVAYSFMFFVDFW